MSSTIGRPNSALPSCAVGCVSVAPHPQATRRAVRARLEPHVVHAVHVCLLAHEAVERRKRAAQARRSQRLRPRLAATQQRMPRSRARTPRSAARRRRRCGQTARSCGPGTRRRATPCASAQSPSSQPACRRAARSGRRRRGQWRCVGSARVRVASACAAAADMARGQPAWSAAAQLMRRMTAGYALCMRRRGVVERVVRRQRRGKGVRQRLRAAPRASQLCGPVRRQMRRNGRTWLLLSAGSSAAAARPPSRPRGSAAESSGAVRLVASRARRRPAVRAAISPGSERGEGLGRREESEAACHVAWPELQSELARCQLAASNRRALRRR